MNGTELPLWVTVPGTLLLVAAGLLTLIGAVGLLRLESFYERMHPPTMGTTLGTGFVLLASMLVSSALEQRPIIHEVLITVFIVTTAPVTAMLLMRAAVFREKRKRETPDSGRDGIETPAHGADGAETQEAAR